MRAADYSSFMELSVLYETDRGIGFETVPGLRRRR
jgi:hypothetical protein